VVTFSVRQRFSRIPPPCHCQKGSRSDNPTKIFPERLEAPDGSGGRRQTAGARVTPANERVTKTNADVAAADGLERQRLVDDAVERPKVAIDRTRGKRYRMALLKI
jgi:hypothetical protein